MKPSNAQPCWIIRAAKHNRLFRILLGWRKIAHQLVEFSFRRTGHTIEMCHSFGSNQVLCNLSTIF